MLITTIITIILLSLMFSGDVSIVEEGYSDSIAS
jgi:hypothetical protein